MSETSSRHAAGSLLACRTLFACCAVSAFAQNQTTSPQAVPSSRQIRPLALNQTRYRLRAGERTRVDALPETLDFIRKARISTVTINGAQTRGFAVGPSTRGDDVVLAASLTMKEGEYAVTVSAVDESGDQRTATANITVDALPAVPPGGSTPPAVLLNGWQFSALPPNGCPIAATGPAATFGSLTTQLVAPAVYFFDNCVEQSVNGSTIEALGVTLGQFLSMVQYPQVDLVSHSMGGLIVRSYLAGLQANGSLSPPLNPRVRKFIEIATPNFGSFLAANYSALLANGTQASEMVPGSSFLWSLGTWNQRGDDLRGVDALGIIGNAGTWRSSIFVNPQLLSASDGVVSLTSASLNFARDPSRTRILPYCHTDPASSAIDCSGKGGIANIDEAPETGQIILSFLAGTSAWQSIGFSNQAQYGGGYFALENAAGTQFTPFSSVSLGSALFESGWTNTIFYNEFATGGTGTFTATSTANQTTNCGPFTVIGGTFSIFRCKFSPTISSVGPLLPNVAGWVVQSGATITINGIGFGQQQCSTCQVTIYPNPPLKVLTWSDQAITAVLPSFNPGALGLSVQTAAGSDYITFMATPAPTPPVISLSAPQLQFAYTMGGASPPPQTVTISNSGGGTLTWVASPSAPWIVLGAPSLVVSINPTGLNPGTYQGTVTISATGATNSPQTISVTLTVTAATVQLTTKNSASFGIVALSPEVIAFSEAPGIAPALVVAPGNPWPPTLGGVHLDITDSAGQTRSAPLYYVTTNAMSYLVPAGIALGPATAKLTTSTGATITGTFNVDRISPGLFTVNATGSGVVAGYWIRATADGTQTYDYLFDPTQPVGSRVPVPVDLGAPTDQVFLSLYGTGFRGATQATATVGGVTVPVSAFAAVGVYQGEDVVNIGPLPRSLAGRGEVSIALTFDGKPANAVTVSIK